MPLSEDAGAWSNDELAGAQLFHPGWLFRNRHLQTMLGNLPPVPWLIRRRAAPLRAAATELLLDCGDGVRLQSFVTAVARASGTALRPMAVLLHGWEGSTESGYVMSLGALLFSRGFDVLRLNLRDHGVDPSPEPRDLPLLPPAGGGGALARIAARFPERRLFLAGFSLGGNFMLRVAADAGAPPSIAGAAAISPVLDPATTLDALERVLALYRRYFVRRWSAVAAPQATGLAGLHDFEPCCGSRTCAAMTAALVRTGTGLPEPRGLPGRLCDHRRRPAELRVPACCSPKTTRSSRRPMFRGSTHPHR